MQIIPFYHPTIKPFEYAHNDFIEIFYKIGFIIEINYPFCVK